MISIITVVKNGADTIGDCLRSVAAQSVHAEHLIVDGNSTDDTIDIVNSYKGTNLRVLTGKDRGIYDAMNKGIRKASGDIIGILNADDMFCGPNVLALIQKVFSGESTEACYGNLVYVARDDIHRTVRYWRAGIFTPRKMYWGWMPPHPTFFVRRSVYIRHGCFDLTLGSSADYELMLRLLLRFRVAVEYIPHILVKMRMGGRSNASLKNRMRANAMDRKAWRVNGLAPLPWTLIAKPLRKLPQYWLKPKVI